MLKMSATTMKILLIPTLILLNNGKPVKQLIGVQTAAALQDLLQKGGS